MTSLRFNLFHITTLFAVLCLVSTAGLAHHRDNHVRGGDETCSDCESPVIVATEDFDWMHPDVSLAYGQGFDGTGTFISVVDDFTSGDTIWGRLGGLGTHDLKMHGEWTSLMASLVAPGADPPENDTTLSYDFNTETPVLLHSGFDVINLSYRLTIHVCALQVRSRIGRCWVNHTNPYLKQRGTPVSVARSFRSPPATTVVLLLAIR